VRKNAVSDGGIRGIGSVAELRARFDQSFAEAPAPADAPFEDLLGIRAGAIPHAVRVSEISRLVVDRTITPVPTPVADLLGFTSYHGSIVPVYDLRAVLGLVEGTKPRWLVIAAAAEVGLAFAEFGGHVRVRRDAILPQDQGQGTTRHVREVVQMPDSVWRIVSIGSVLEAIRGRVPPGAPTKER
jgi:chemotaxis signal transduction protein